MTEIGTKEGQIDTSALYAGGALNSLGEEKTGEIARTVAGELARRPDTMIGFSEVQLRESIEEGRAAAVLDRQGDLTAFAQYWPYEVDFTGDDHLAGLEVYEVGSWLRFPGEGAKNGEARKVFEACLKAGERRHPSAGFIAIVEEGNERASTILKNMGGVEIGKKISKHVIREDSNPANMVIYRMNGNAIKGPK
jgi:hypothetical protein